MKRLYQFVLIMLIIFGSSRFVCPGMLVRVTDPRYFERQQEIIFPHAEVKLVTFEFEDVSDSGERGKQRAKELHDQFLSSIHDLHGGAIITYTTPLGERIENYRVKAEEVAKNQNAQMTLWGRIFIDKTGRSLINARLFLIEAPPGISASYQENVPLIEDGPPVLVKGVIDAPITQLRVDFNTVENDVSPLAFFLSGLARYYKGAVRSGTNAVRWLESSIMDFKKYTDLIPETLDRGALAQAHLYLARAYVRLADSKPAQADSIFSKAQYHIEKAVLLNPYDAGVVTVQAVIAVRQHAEPETIRKFLVKAVELDPTDSNIRLNLAVLESTEGRVKEALKQLDNASFVHQMNTQQPLPLADQLREQLIEYAP